MIDLSDVYAFIQSMQLMSDELGTYHGLVRYEGYDGTPSGMREFVSGVSG